MKIYVILALSLLAAIDATGASRGDTVSSQSGFEAVLQQARDGKAVNVTLSPGTYRFDKPVKTSAPFRISGKDAVIKGIADIYSREDAVRKEDGFYVCRLASPLPPFCLFLDDKDGIIPVCESADENTLVNLCPEVKGEVSKETGIKVRLAVPPSLAGADAASVKCSYGYFDCGWTVGRFKVDGIEGSELLCTMLNTVNTRTFSYEKTCYKHDVRFVLFNAARKQGCISYTDTEIFIPEQYGSVQLMKATKEPALVSKSDLELSGLDFRNFGTISVSHRPEDILRITSCSFLNSITSSLAISKKSSSELVPGIIEGCSFLHCSLVSGPMVYISGPFSGNPVCVVRNSTFRRYDDAPLMYKNTGSIIKMNGDSEVSGCTLSNTPRCHIYSNRGYNLIKNNVIYNSEVFNSFRDRNLSNDFGLIYVNHFTGKNEDAISTRKHHAVIEDCLLYGALAHAHDARGIMIDDGRGDVVCRRNVVHIPGTFYSIDSRECRKFIGTSSIRNLFENNVVTLRYRLQGGVDVPESDLPVSSGNIILGKVENVLKRNNVKKGDVVFEDAVVSGIEDGKLVVDSQTAKALKKLIRSPHIK